MKSEDKTYDFGIIGSGPAGYTAAIKASQLGKSVILFEKEFLGGTCLNKGCIPTKTYLHCADLYNSIKKASNFGIEVENTNIDFEKITDRKDKTVEKIRKSLEMLLKSYGIEIVFAQAQITNKSQIEADEKTYNCKNILTATGSKPRGLKGFDFDHEFILSSDDILNLKILPKKIAIVGSGAIGVEWTRIFSAFGVEVHLIEIAKNLLPGADFEISQRLERIFKMARVKMYLSTSVDKIENKKIFLSSGETIEPDFVLFATGRQIENIDKDSENTSSIKIGDCSGGIQLAHFASHQGVNVVENIVLDKEIKEFITPFVIYGNPEIAWFGKTEQELEGKDYKKAVFPISALGKAQAEGNLEGFIKILSNNDKILGAHIISKEASAMVHQLLIAAQNDVKVNELKHTCFAHPTYSEGVYEALLGLDNESLSLLKTV